jgi:hypothetical protein
MRLTQARVDSCLYVRKGSKEDSVVCVGTWVDDLIVTGTKKDIDDFEKELKTYYEITSNRGDKISYISLYIETMRNTGERLLSQKGYRVDMLNKFKSDSMKVRGIVKTPAADNLVTGEDNTEAYECPNHYLSIVMAIMYLARFTRPEILFSVSYLATKGMKPTIRDYHAACRIMRYIECSGDYGLLFKKAESGKIRITCDASHVLHKDGKGQGGITVSLGSAIVHAKSNKIK